MTKARMLERIDLVGPRTRIGTGLLALLVVAVPAATGGRPSLP